jgi:ABC-2 type transport system permease protein
MTKKKRHNKYYKFGAYLLVVVLLNVAGVTLFVRADLTSDNIYSLSKASRNAVAELSEPLTINVFFTKNLPAPHNNTERYLRDMLEEYSIHSNKNFNYRFYDVSAEEGDISEDAKQNQQIARNYGIYPVQIQVIEQDEVKFQNAYMGLVMIHGDVIEKIPTITSTEDLEYQITSKIEKMSNKISTLLNLDSPVQLKLFFSSSIEAVEPQLRMSGLMDIPHKVEEMADRLNDKYYGKLELSVLDPSLNPSLEEQVNSYNVLTLRWPSLKDAAGNEVVPPGHASAGLVVEKGEKFQTIQLIRVINLPLFGTQYQMANLDEIEDQISEVIDNVIDINKKIGYLSSHGTIPLRGAPQIPGMRQADQMNLGNFSRLVSNDYSIVEIDLKEEEVIPEGIDCLIIAGPREEFNDYELFQIDQFLMKGKSLAIFLDTYEEIQLPQGQQQFGRQPMYRPINTGLDKILDHYGVTVEKAYVMDTNCYEQRVDQMFGGGKRALYFAPVILNENINNDLPFMKNIKGLIMLMSAPVRLDKSKLDENGLVANTLLSSSEQSWLMKGRINLMAMQPPANEGEMQSQPLAALIEGEFPSYFAGKGIPEKPEEPEPVEEGEFGGEEGGEGAAAEIAATGSGAEEGETFKDFTPVGAVIDRGGQGKIFLTGTAEILKDNVVDENGKTPNATMVLNVLDDLNSRDEYAEMRSKTQRFNPLKETGAGVKTFVKTFNIAGLPLLVVLYGIIVWVRRTARKRTIQAMFSR